MTRSGWFAARPSGTEDVFKLYAESFDGEQHLERILEQAQELLATASELARARAALAADDRVGTRFGEYEIDSLIGVGGMGKVYKATADDGTSVALKLVKRGPGARRDVQAPLQARGPDRSDRAQPPRRPGEGHRRARRPSVPGRAVHRRGRARSEARAGGSASTSPTTVRICAQVADGLHALWEAGMVHRDVKPANILLDLTGNAYITDFGLAKDSDGTVLTRPGQPLGSMDYMPPEQIRGEPVTGAADIYSLGCVVFECVYGRPPFADREGMRVLWAHLQDEPPDRPPSRDRHPARVRQALNGGAAQGTRRAAPHEHRVRPLALSGRRHCRSKTPPADPARARCASVGHVTLQLAVRAVGSRCSARGAARALPRTRSAPLGFARDSARGHEEPRLQPPRRSAPRSGRRSTWTNEDSLRTT